MLMARLTLRPKRNGKAARDTLERMTGYYLDSLGNRWQTDHSSVTTWIRREYHVYVNIPARDALALRHHSDFAME